MFTTLTKGFKKAFVVDAEVIDALYEEVTKYVEDLHIKFSCSDGSENEPQDLKELYEFPNPNNRQIQSIEISSPYGKDPHADIKIRNEYPNNELIHYELRGDEKDVLLLGRKIEEILSNSFQWYSYLLTTRWIIAFIVWTIGALAIGAGLPIGTTEPNVLLLSIGPVCFLTVGIAWLFGNKVFPMAVFAIGGGKNRHAASVQRRRRLGEGVILALVVALLAAFIMSWFRN